MALAVCFSLLTLGAGFATLRLLGVAKGALSLGLAPAAGLAVLSIVASWAVSVGMPPPVGGVLLLCISLIGFGVVLRDRRAFSIAARSLSRQDRVAAAVLIAALAVAAVSTGVALAGSPVPLSPHDGAYHAQAIDAHRSGQPWVDWYPQGLAALFGNILELAPWLDTARGAFELGLALPLLALVAVFGLAISIWRDLPMAAAAALLLSLTYVYPYFSQLWSGWPLAMALILVVGQWAVGYEYLASASWRWAVFSGVLLGSMVLVHGSELLTTLLILLVLLASVRGRLDWPRLGRHTLLAAGVALACAAPYLPTLWHWAGAGGAYVVGLADGQGGQGGANVSATLGPDPFVVFALGALGVDLPIRLGLLVVGVLFVFRARVGRTVVVVGVLFAMIASIFTFLGGIPGIREVYAATYPWGMHYRVFMVVAITQVLLAGAGGVVVLRWMLRRTQGRTRAARLVRRSMPLLFFAWLGLMTWAMTVFLSYPAQLALGYGDDDATAMNWLREHASPGDVVANDGFADAGIWTPYKAGLQILMPRFLTTADGDSRRLVLDNIGRLDQRPDAAAAACALHVAYVYRGAHASDWDARGFPSLDELLASPALEEVFSSGDAVVFRTKLACPA